MKEVSGYWDKNKRECILGMLVSVRQNPSGETERKVIQYDHNRNIHATSENTQEEKGKFYKIKSEIIIL